VNRVHPSRFEARSVSLLRRRVARLITDRPGRAGCRLLWLLLLANLPVTAGDWPRFLGPHANGTCEETGLIDRFPEEGPPRLWSRRVGSGYSAPSIRGRVLVLHHRIGNEEVVEAMTTDTGRTLWQHRDPTQFVDPYGYNNGPRSTPLLTSNRCYTFGAEGRLDCLDLRTGRLLWQRRTGEDWQVPPAFFGVGSSPWLEGDRLLVMVGGMPNAGMVALDARTGRTLWENVGRDTWEGLLKLGWRGTPPVRWAQEDKQASYATPVGATIHGRRHVFCLMRQGLVSIDPATGAVRFSRWFRARVSESVNAATPVVVEDMVFISAAYYGVGAVLLRVRPDGRHFDEMWHNTVLEVHFSTPVYHRGFLYAFSGRNPPDARLRCVEFRTGRLQWDRDESWRRTRRGQPPVYGRGSMILADGKLIVLGEGGLLGLWRPNPKRPEELSRWQVPELHYPCWTAPVLAQGRLYLRSENRLLCFDLRR